MLIREPIKLKRFVSRFGTRLRNKLESTKLKLTSKGGMFRLRRVIKYGFICRRNDFLIENFLKFNLELMVPFKMVKKIGDNAYKIELPDDYGVSATFNVADLSPDLDDKRQAP